MLQCMKLGASRTEKDEIAWFKSSQCPSQATPDEEIIQSQNIVYGRVVLNDGVSGTRCDSLLMTSGRKRYGSFDDCRYLDLVERLK